MLVVQAGVRIRRARAVPVDRCKRTLTLYTVTNTAGTVWGTYIWLFVDIGVISQTLMVIASNRRLSWLLSNL